MKFRHYVKFAKIYFIINALYFLIMAPVAFYGWNVWWEAINCSYSELPVAMKYLLTLCEILGRIHFAVLGVLVNLTGFFITKNFKTVYGSIKEFLE